MQYTYIYICLCTFCVWLNLVYMRVCCVYVCRGICLVYFVFLCFCFYLKYWLNILLLLLLLVFTRVISSWLRGRRVCADRGRRLASAIPFVRRGSPMLQLCNWTHTHTKKLDIRRKRRNHAQITLERSNSSETYLSLPRSRYVRLRSEISCVISPFFSDRPCIPFLWNANILSGRQTTQIIQQQREHRCQYGRTTAPMPNGPLSGNSPILSTWKSNSSCGRSFLLCRGLPSNVTTRTVFPWHTNIASLSIYENYPKKMFQSGC